MDQQRWIFRRNFQIDIRLSPGICSGLFIYSLFQFTHLRKNDQIEVDKRYN